MTSVEHFLVPSYYKLLTMLLLAGEILPTLTYATFLNLSDFFEYLIFSLSTHTV